MVLIGNKKGGGIKVHRCCLPRIDVRVINLEESLIITRDKVDSKKEEKRDRDRAVEVIVLSHRTGRANYCPN